MEGQSQPRTPSWKAAVIAAAVATAAMLVTGTGTLGQFSAQDHRPAGAQTANPAGGPLHTERATPAGWRDAEHLGAFSAPAAHPATATSESPGVDPVAPAPAAPATPTAPATATVTTQPPAIGPAPETVRTPEQTEAVAAQPPVTEPAPAAPHPDPGTSNLEARVHAAYDTAVPQRWRHHVTAIEVIGGSSSWANHDGTLEISTYHAERDWERLRAIIAHEVGHLIAFAEGSGTYNGAGPDGFPDTTDGAERWANCVAEVFTGYRLRDTGAAACDDNAAAWSAAWLNS